MRSRSTILILTLAIFGGLISSPVMSKETGGDMMFDLPDLVRASDMVIRGQVVRMEQEPRESRIKIEVLDTFMGDPDIRYVHVLHRGGKFLVDETEPYFMSYETALLFLRSEGESYRVVFGKQGKKTITNQNVYLHPENNFLTVKWKKFLPKLTQAIEEASEETSS